MATFNIPTPVRELPYVDGLLMEMLRPTLPAYQVVTVYPAPDLRQYPILLVRRIGGGAVHMSLLDSALVQVDCFAHERRQAADGVEFVRQVFEYAWQNQTVLTDGHIGRVNEISGPVETRDNDQPADLYRFGATYDILIRPNERSA